LRRAEPYFTFASLGSTHQADGLGRSGGGGVQVARGGARGGQAHLDPNTCFNCFDFDSRSGFNITMIPVKL
jgi:hypothetical protein